MEHITRRVRSCILSIWEPTWLGTRVHCDPNDTKIKKKIKKNYLKKGRGTLSITEAPLILYQKIGIYSGNQN